VVINVQFHLFQEAINQFTVVIALDNTNQMILVMIRPSRDDRGSRYSRDDRGSRYSRDDRGSRYSRDDRGSRNSRDNDREDTTVTCADCGDQCTVPFVPRSNKPVYCSDCFRQYKPDDSGNDRPSRDDRGSRYSRDEEVPETTEVQEILEIMTEKTQL